MTKKNKNKKRNLSSPDNGANQPEKKSAMNSNVNTAPIGSQCVNMNNTSTPGYVQPMNLNNMNNYSSYQTPAGVFFSPQPQQFVTPSTQPPTPPTQPSQTQQTNFQQVILDRFDALDHKLGKLDAIEKQLSTLSQKMSSMDSRISVLETTASETKDKLSQIENSRAFDSQVLDEIRSTQSQIDRDLKKDKDRVDQLSRDCKNMQIMNEDILDLQSRSMRDNLLFMGFTECPSPDERRTENCSKTVLDFCENTLKIADPHSSIKIERAHRMGKYNNDRKRPIVVKFNHYPDKMLVKKRAAEELKGSDQWVTEQYPKTIQDRRKILIEAMKKARAAGKRASVSYDKLFIDGKMYTVDNLSSSGFS